MHPLLDRPHPDCGSEIESLKLCHKDTWKKFTGQCNDIKIALDVCFKAEKQRLLHQSIKDAKAYKLIEEECIKVAVGHNMTFDEYMQKDRDSRRST